VGVGCFSKSGVGVREEVFGLEFPVAVLFEEIVVGVPELGYGGKGNVL
jgi:hypothetical protein